MSEAETLNCQEKCEMPEGVVLKEVPPPRHAWGDVFGCPNGGCGKFFMATKTA